MKKNCNRIRFIENKFAPACIQCVPLVAIKEVSRKKAEIKRNKIRISRIRIKIPVLYFFLENIHRIRLNFLGKRNIDLSQEQKKDNQEFTVLCNFQSVKKIKFLVINVIKKKYCLTILISQLSLICLIVIIAKI